MSKVVAAKGEIHSFRDASDFLIDGHTNNRQIAPNTLVCCTGDCIAIRLKNIQSAIVFKAIPFLTGLSVLFVGGKLFYLF